MLKILGRETSGGAVIPEIDGLRFFAILSVILYHLDYTLTERTSRFLTPYRNAHAAIAFGPASLGNSLRHALHQGWFGVELFFAISGFILGMPFARQYLGTAPPVSLNRYFLRRVTRLEPPYLINLALFTAIWLLVKHRPATEALSHALASSVYMHNLIFSGQDPISSVIWSLEVEVQFYILAPLLTMVFLIQDRTTRRVAIIAGMLVFGALQPTVAGWMPYRGTILHFLQYFLSGFLLVDLYLDKLCETSRHPWIWDMVVWGSIGVIIVTLERKFMVDIVAPFLILAAYMGAFRGRFWRSILRHPAIFTLGGMCYTVYMYHVMIIIALKPWTTRLAWTDGFAANYAIQAFLIIPSVFAVSAVLFIILEKPFMRRDWPQLFAARMRSCVP